MTPAQRKQWEQDNARKVAEYLASGGRIQQLPAPGQPRPEDFPGNWLSTEEAVAMTGISKVRLTRWRNTNAPHCPKTRKVGKRVEWFRPGIEALMAKYGRAA